MSILGLSDTIVITSDTQRHSTFHRGPCDRGHSVLILHPATETRQLQDFANENPKQCCNLHRDAEQTRRCEVLVVLGNAFLGIVGL